MSLIEKVIIKKPREVSGSIVQNAFDYQIKFSAYLALELISNQKDFIALIEYLDDVVIIDDIDNPTEITFYQVKSTDSGNISLTTILSDKYFEKMYENTKDFDITESKAVLVSNAKFKFNVKNKSSNYIEHKEFNVEIKVEDFISASPKKETLLKEIKSKLGEEVKIDNFYLLRTSLPYVGHDNFVKGELLNYLTKKNSKLDTIAIKVMYEEFINKLKVAASNTYRNSTNSIKGIFDKKGFSKRDFDKLEKQALDLMIPLDGNKIYTYAIDTLNYQPLNSNILVFNKNYNEFSLNIIRNKEIYRKVLSVIESINLNSVNNNELIPTIIKVCDSNREINQTTFYKEYKEFIALVYVFKIGDNLL